MAVFKIYNIGNIAMCGYSTIGNKLVNIVNIVFTEEDEIVKFASKGDAEIHRKTRMGSYMKTTQMVKGCPVFEQVDKLEDEHQYFLFVGPDGRWRVGPDVTSYSGSVLKHPKKNAAMLPTTGWMYYLDDSWLEDKSLLLMKHPEGKGTKLLTDSHNNTQILKHIHSHTHSHIATLTQTHAHIHTHMFTLTYSH